jgi:hypothetical protein
LKRKNAESRTASILPSQIVIPSHFSQLVHICKKQKTE